MMEKRVTLDLSEVDGIHRLLGLFEIRVQDEGLLETELCLLQVLQIHVKAADVVIHLWLVRMDLEGFLVLLKGCLIIPPFPV